MRKFWIPFLGAAALSALPATAATVFDFTQGLYTNSSGQVTDTCSAGSNASCGTGASSSNDDLSSYSIKPSGQTGTPITATATAFYQTGTSSGPSSSAKLTGALTGEYSGNGIGICESASSPNCADPNHQINNGTDLSLTSNTGTTDNFEFMLIQFSSAVDLSSITLGNYGTTGSNADPFIATYLTSTSSDSLTQMEAALEGTSISALANTNGFGSASQTTCTTNCAVDDVGTTETLSGTDITYLLIGASDLSGAAGTDFFKIQDLTATAHQTTATPEPATFALLGLALSGLGLYGRKRKSGK